MGRRPPFAVTIPSARPPSPARRQPARRAIARRRRDEASRTWPVLARGDHGLAFRIRGAEPEDDAPRFMAEARGTRMMWCRPKRWKAAKRAAVGVRGRSRRSAGRVSHPGLCSAFGKRAHYFRDADRVHRRNRVANPTQGDGGHQHKHAQDERVLDEALATLEPSAPR